METEARAAIKTKTGQANPWLMVAIASLANFALYIIIFGVPPVIPSLVQLGLTHEQAGLLMTVTLVTYCLCSILGGILADAFGARPVLTLGLLLASVSGLLFTLTDNFLLMVALRTLVGVGCGCVFAPGLRFLLAALPKEISGMGIGWYMIAINVGVATPMFVTPLMMDQFGWHGPLAVFAIFGGLMAVVFWRLAQEVHPADAGQGTEPVASGTATGGFWSLALVLVAVASLLRMSQTYGILTWAPSYLTETLDFNPAEVAAATAVLSLSNVPALLFAGWLCDRTTGKVPVAMVGLAISTIGASLAWIHSGSFWPITAIMFAIGFGTGLGSVPIFALPAMTVPRSYVGRATGFASTLTFAGPIFTAYLGGLIKTGTGQYDLALMVFGLAPAVGIITLLPLARSFRPKW